MSSLWLVVRLSWRSFFRDRTAQLASALTLTTSFAVVPLMTVTLAVLQSLPHMDALALQLQSWVLAHLLPSTSVQLQSHLQAFSQQAHRLTWLGLCMLLLTSVLMLMKVEAAFNLIWRVPVRRAGVHTYARYWALISLGPILLAALFALSSYLTTLSLWSTTWHLLDHLLPGLALLQLTLSCLAFTLLYAIVPNCKVPWAAAACGGVLAGFLFELAKQAFALFIHSFGTYTLIYGAFAIFPVFLLWLQLSWMIVLLGVHASRAWALPYSVADETVPLQMFFELLAVLQVRQRHGEGLPEIEAMQLAHAAHHDEWQPVLTALLRLHMVSRDEAGMLYLVRDLRHISLAELIIQLPWPWPPVQALRRPGAPAWALRLAQMVAALRAYEAQHLAISLAELLDDEADAPYTDALSSPCE